MTRFPRRIVTFAAIALAVLASSATAAPAFRSENGMVYDSVAKRIVMFGGFDSHVAYATATRFNDIWEYDGATSTWYNVTPPSGAAPPPRGGHAFAFDPTRRVVVMFGGWSPSQGFMNDTWEWNCAARSWTKISPAVSPSGLNGSRMAYDSAGGRMILFGGVDANHFYNDTWQYTGSNWVKIATTASSTAGHTFNGRTYHEIVYHSGRGRLIIFGGVGYPNNQTVGTVNDFNDMWELQGTKWVEITPAGSTPGGRGWFGMTYESATNRVLLFGGWNNTSAFSYADTWSWDGTSWSLLAASSSIGARDSFAMTYDAGRSRSVLFGWYLSDLWEITGSTWTVVATTDVLPPSTPQGMRVKVP